jgi:hypothetical protein
MKFFDLNFPLWYLRNVERGFMAGGPLRAGEPAVYLFSEQNLAESYVARKAEAPDAVAVESVDRDHFLDFLDMAEREDFTHVIVNPGPLPSAYGSIREMRAGFEGQG